MKAAVGLLETLGLTPAMVAIDAMLKTAPVHVAQVEINDFLGVCVKITGSVDAVSVALQTGQRLAAQMGGQPITDMIPQLTDEAVPIVFSPPEYNPLIQQDVVFTASEQETIMSQENQFALGLIETQGFTAVFEAIDTACKTANVQVIGKEKLGGGYVTVVIKGELSAVRAAVEMGQTKVEGLGKLIAAHVIARPSEAVLGLLPKV